MSLPCQQLTVDVPEELKDTVIGELSEHGASGIWENGEPSPGITRLEIYFNQGFNRTDVESSIQSVFLRANRTPPGIRVDTVADRDWLGEWKKSYVSFPIGREFFIIPSWSDTVCPAGRQPIRIDPGQAFGTGTHETTQLTLECLEDHAEKLARSGQILDLGTGSGILSIAARLLGFNPIIGCDTDLDSIHVAVENIQRNIDSSIPVFCGSIDSLSSESLELLLCNLTADVITDIFDEIHRVVRPGGAAILSGILGEQRGQICEIVTRHGWAIEDDRTRGEWIALVIRKPA